MALFRRAVSYGQSRHRFAWHASQSPSSRRDRLVRRCLPLRVDRARDVAVAGEIMPLGGTILQDHPTKIQSAATSNRPVACYCLRCGHLYLRTMSLGCPEHNNSVIHPFHDCFCGADDVLCLSVAEICPFQGWKEVCQSRAEDRGRGGCGSSMAWTLFVRETVA